jgi:putative phosphoribosyl transferase
MTHPGSRRTGAVRSLEDPTSVVPAEGVFEDRVDAGRRLGALLERFRDERPVVLGIPRGGVPVAAEVARMLHAELDVAVVRKIGAPQNPEFALGAVGEGGVLVLSRETVRALALSDAQLGALVARARVELEQRLRRYRDERGPAALRGRTAIVIDDGLATGQSARAALRSVRARGAAHVILASPVAAPEAVEALRSEADEIVSVEAPADLWAVGLWYADFGPTSDDEVLALLAENRARPHEFERLG